MNMSMKGMMETYMSVTAVLSSREARRSYIRMSNSVRKTGAG